MSSVTPDRSDNDGPQPYLVFSTLHARISKLAYLPDGRRVVSGDEYGTVRVWNLEDGKQEGTSMAHESDICGISVTRDGTKIISSYRGGEIKVWNVESHEIVEEWTHPEGWPKIVISPDDRLIAAGGETVVFYTMAGIQVNHFIKVGSYVWPLCFSPNGKKLACGTSDDIRVYDVDSGTLLSESQQKRVYCVLWSHDGSRLFSGSADGTIRCWNSDTGEQIGHPWTGHTDWIHSLSLSPDGSILASASWDETVRFWDATTGQPIGRLQHDKEVNAVRFSPSGEFVVSGGWDGKIYLWRVPWLNSVENRVRAPTRWTSVFILIALSI